jgi:hypothetical protein
LTLIRSTDAEDPELSGDVLALRARRIGSGLAAPGAASPPLPSRDRRGARSASRLRRRPLSRPLSGPRLGLNAAREARLAQAGAVYLVAATLLLTLAAAGTYKLLPETVQLGIPPWMAGPFGHTGINLGWGGALSVVSLMVLAYVCVARRAEALPARALVTVILLSHLLLLLAPPLLSTDVFSYQAYAKLGAAYGTNPYLHGPSAIQLDPLYSFVGADWVNTPTAYGPLFTVLSYALAPLSIAASALAYRTLAAAASLLSVAIVWKAARLRGLEPRRAAALVGLNPLTVLYGVGGGHNDLLMLLPFCAAVLLALTGRPRSTGASVMVAAGLKLTAGILLPFTLASGRTGRFGNRRVLQGAAVTAAAIAALSLAFFGLGALNLAHTLSQNQAQHAVNSFAGLAYSVLGLRTLSRIISAVLSVVFLGSFVWLVLRVWRGRMDWIDGAAWATLVLLVCAASLLPWYIAWLLPLAALARDRRLFSGTLIITLLIFGTQISNYVPHT